MLDSEVFGDRTNSRFIGQSNLAKGPAIPQRPMGTDANQGDVRAYENRPGATMQNPIASRETIYQDAITGRTIDDPNAQSDRSSITAPDGTQRMVSFDRSRDGMSSGEVMQGLYDRGMESARSWGGNDLMQARAGLAMAAGNMPSTVNPADAMSFYPLRQQKKFDLANLDSFIRRTPVTDGTSFDDWFQQNGLG